MNETEREQLIKKAQAKFGKPFITDFPVPRVTEKSSRLLEIEAQQKGEARRNVVAIKRGS